MEFYTDNKGKDIVCRDDSGIHHVLDPDNSGQIIDRVFNLIKSDYAEAFKALMAQYGKSADFKFLIVQRFLKCNVSSIDDYEDLNTDGLFRFEYIHCPLRGECKVENIVCRPQITTALSKRELQIVKLIASGLKDDQIADEIFISPFTVDNHRKSILRKLNLHSKSQITAWAHKNVLT